jgi:hypothetical protein
LILDQARTTVLSGGTKQRHRMQYETPGGIAMLKKIALVTILVATAFVGMSVAKAGSGVRLPKAPQGLCWPAGMPGC